MVKDLVPLSSPKWFLAMHKSQWMYTRVGLDNTVLDVGCADKVAWGDAPWPITTLDKERRGEPEPCNPDVVGMAEALPFKDNSFDIVSLMEVLEHLEEPGLALKEAIRVARIKVIMSVPWEAEWTSDKKPFTNPGHMQDYTPDTFRLLLDPLNMPYQIQIIRIPGWAWIVGEIYCCKRPQ